MRKLLSLLAVAVILSFGANSYGETIQDASWVRNTAKWWSQGQVGDSDFIKVVQFLLHYGTVLNPIGANQTSVSPVTSIPSWIRASAGWWAVGKISDQDFTTEIQYLVRSDIIRLNANPTFDLSSPAFENNGTIPSKYTCDGVGISPPLVVYGAPPNAKSLALTVVDIDAPNGPFTHWIMWNIPTNVIALNGSSLAFPQGLTTAGTNGYKGPCPPYGTHRYFFNLYALDTTLNLGADSTRSVLEKVMSGHVVGKTFLMGTYSRG